MKADDAVEALSQQFGDAVSGVVRFRGEVSVVVARDAIQPVASACESQLGFNFLSDLTATDWLDRIPRFEVVYHLTSLRHWSRLRLKVLVDSGQSVPTVSGVWGAANWAEREVWDLFGIEFEGHPDLRRLLMPDGWIGHPLRKDFAQTQIALPRPRDEKIDTVSYVKHQQ